MVLLISVYSNFQSLNLFKFFSEELISLHPHTLEQRMEVLVPCQCLWMSHLASSEFLDGRRIERLWHKSLVTPKDSRRFDPKTFVDFNTKASTIQTESQGCEFIELKTVDGCLVPGKSLYICHNKT
jgi:hypothetical protein